MRRTLAWLGLLAPLACSVQSGTETGNPPIFADVQVGLAVRAGDPAIAGLPGEPGGGALVEAAWIAVDRIRFVQGEVCDGPGETEYDLGGVAADLVADPHLLAFEGREGRYCRVRVELAPGAGAPGAPSEFADRTVVLAGRRGDGVPFTIASRSDARLDLRGRDGASFALDDARRAVVIAFDVSAWLAGVRLDDAEVDGGRIVVDEERNEELLDAFEEAVEAALELHRDDDADGQVDDDEEGPIDD